MEWDQIIHKDNADQVEKSAIDAVLTSVKLPHALISVMSVTRLVERIMA